MEGLIPLGVLIVVVVVSISIGSHSMDRARIEAVTRRKGWLDVEITWEPFGPGWFFEEDARLYRVSYRDSNGVRHSVYCKTSMGTGVYWRDEEGTPHGGSRDGSTIHHRVRDGDSVATDDIPIDGNGLPIRDGADADTYVFTPADGAESAVIVDYRPQEQRIRLESVAEVAYDSATRTIRYTGSNDVACVIELDTIDVPGGVRMEDAVVRSIVATDAEGRRIAVRLA